MGDFVGLLVFHGFSFRLYLVRHGGCGFCFSFYYFCSVRVLFFVSLLSKKMAAAVGGKTQHEVRRDCLSYNSIIAVYLKYVFFYFIFKELQRIVFFISNLFLFPLYVSFLFLKICTSLIRALIFCLN